jgi:DnaJ-class molecular chaperone
MVGLSAHESLCPICQGQDYIKNGCEMCDGTGVVINERRGAERHDDSIAAEFTRLRNLVAEQHAKIVEQEELMQLTTRTIETITVFLTTLKGERA